jgi:hypothetical protein
MFMQQCEVDSMTQTAVTDGLIVSLADDHRSCHHKLVLAK